MLYLHIPFCHRKCTYCAFYSTVSAGGRQAYVEALCSELEYRRAAMPRPLRTVYLGGGTPSVLTLDQLGRLVGTVRCCYDVGRLEEATVEANPEDLTAAYAAGLAGLRFFNRVSIGIQSFRDEDLRVLNRRHTARQALEAVGNVAAAGFENISVDLIYGLPGQTLAAWRENLAVLARLPVNHFSAYALTVEPGTMLEQQIVRQKVVLPGEEEVLSHYGALVDWASREGFEQYEISNFCRPPHRSVHNSRYWDRTPYLGVGAAAHSFDGVRRRWNVADVRQYVESVAAGDAAHEAELLTPADCYNEYVMTALRTVEGIEKRRVDGPFVGHLARAVAPALAAGLLVETPTHYRPTPSGLLQADRLAVDLMA